MAGAYRESVPALLAGDIRKIFALKLGVDSSGVKFGDVDSLAVMSGVDSSVVRSSDSSAGMSDIGLSGVKSGVDSLAGMSDIGLSGVKSGVDSSVVMAGDGFYALCINAVNGCSPRVIYLKPSLFPHVVVRWNKRDGSSREQSITVRTNGVFYGIECPTCTKIVIALFLCKVFKCATCASLHTRTNDKKILQDLRKAHDLIERFDPLWEGLQARSKFEWIDGY